MSAKPIKSILFVCLGNICRSPLAEGVFRAVLAERGLGQDILLDSAGNRRLASRLGPGSALDRDRRPPRHRHFRTEGAQGQAGGFRALRPDPRHGPANVRDLQALAPAGVRDRIHLFLDFAQGSDRDVPDPYYDGRGRASRRSTA